MKNSKRLTIDSISEWFNKQINLELLFKKNSQRRLFDFNNLRNDIS